MSLKILLSAVVLTMITYYLYSSSYILNVIEAVKPKLVKETSNDNNQSNAPNTPPRTTASLQAVVNKVRSSSARIVTRNCTMWQFPDQLQSFDQPRIILDPNRFLYPGLIWGPNNQINGLMHTIYLSITLNRYVKICMLSLERIIIRFLNQINIQIGYYLRNPRDDCLLLETLCGD